MITVRDGKYRVAMFSKIFDIYRIIFSIFSFYSIGLGDVS